MAPADTALDPGTLETLGLLKKAGLLAFFAIFVGVLVWVVLGRREVFRRHASIPLHDEPVEPRRPQDALAQDTPSEDIR